MLSPHTGTEVNGLRNTVLQSVRWHAWQGWYSTIYSVAFIVRTPKVLLAKGETLLYANMHAEHLFGTLCRVAADSITVVCACVDLIFVAHRTTW